MGDTCAFGPPQIPVESLYLGMSLWEKPCFPNPFKKCLVCQYPSYYLEPCKENIFSQHLSLPEKESLQDSSHETQQSEKGCN